MPGHKGRGPLGCEELDITEIAGADELYEAEWAASMYLFKEKKNYWITAVPATFMSAVSATYFVLAPECLGGLLNHKTAEGAIVYNTAVAYPVGILFAIAMLALFIYATKKQTVKKTA